MPMPVRGANVLSCVEVILFTLGMTGFEHDFLNFNFLAVPNFRKAFDASRHGPGVVFVAMSRPGRHGRL